MNPNIESNENVDILDLLDEDLLPSNDECDAKEQMKLQLDPEWWSEWSLGG